jgi:hypothetical protein
MDDKHSDTAKNDLKFTPVELLQRIIEMQGLPEEIAKKFLAAKGTLKGRNNEKE